MTTDPDKAKGYAPGKRVWLRESWDGRLKAHEIGPGAEHLVVGPRGDSTDEYGRIEVWLADGRNWRIRKDILRLTPPSGLDAKREKAATAKPKPRKEAIRPEAGEELSLLDLEDAT